MADIPLSLMGAPRSRREVAVARYLLFAQPQPRAAGGLDDLVATFASEDEARQGFRELRLHPAYREGWAELVCLNGRNGPIRLCWFGERWSPAVVLQAAHVGSPRRRWRRR